MHVGGDYHSIVGGDITSKQNLEYNLRHGVKHLAAEARKNPQGAWDPDELQRMKDNCDKYGVVFVAIRMNSHCINLLRKGPERDPEIDIIVGNIRKAAQIGVRIITYHCEVISYRRNGKATGRGGTTSDSFKLEAICPDHMPSHPDDPGGFQAFAFSYGYIKATHSYDFCIHYTSPV